MTAAAPIQNRELVHDGSRPGRDLSCRLDGRKGRWRIPWETLEQARNVCCQSEPSEAEFSPARETARRGITRPYIVPERSSRHSRRRLSLSVIGRHPEPARGAILAPARTQAAGRPLPYRIASIGDNRAARIAG